MEGKIGARDLKVTPGNQQRRANAIYKLCIVLVAGLAFLHVCLSDSMWLFNPHIVAYSRNLPHEDRIDIPMLLHSLASKPTFLSTFAWWHQSWTFETAYWRPLTMQSFWLEKRFFGLDRYDLWMWVNVFWNVAFLLLLNQYVRALTGHRDLALLSVALYCLPMPISFAHGVLDPGPFSDVVMASWKDQPDLWTDTLVVGALLLAYRRQFGLTLLCCALAVCFKESGWLAFPLLLIQLAATKRFREVSWRWYAAAAITVAALLVFRLSAGPEVFRGYHLGSNHNWPTRYIRSVCGVYFLMLILYPACWVFGHALYFSGLALRKRGPGIALGVFLVLAGFSGWFYTRVSDMTLMEAFFGLIDFADVRAFAAGAVAVWLVAVAVLVRRRELLGWFVYFAALGAVSSGPYVAATQVLVHALHLAFAFQSVLGAILALALAEAIIGRVSAMGGRKPLTAANPG